MTCAVSSRARARAGGLPPATLLAAILALTAAGPPLRLSGQEPPRPARVEVEPSRAEVTLGESVALTARALDGEGAALTGLDVRWLTTDDDVVSLSPDGNVTAVAPGTAQVTALMGGRVGFATVVVPPPPPVSLTATLPVASLPVGTSAPVAVRALDARGEPVGDPPLTFRSTAPSVADVDAEGRVFARAPGEAVIRVDAGSAADEVRVTVEPSGEGEFHLQPAAPAPVRTGDVVRFGVTAGGEPVYPAWAVSGSGAQIEAEGPEGVFVAEEPGRYRVTAWIGESEVRSTFVDVEPREYESQLVEVGRGPISAHHSGDMWVFEGVDGRDYVYIGTFFHDWAKVWDVTDPENPVLTDSLQLDARRINDVKIHPNGELGILTREGASGRANGMVFLDLSTPAHPTILSEYTETVTGGVHNVWIRGDHDLVYACHNGTSDMHIIDISDPENPREVGRWGLDRRVKTLHDVFVQDGYAYLSYWDDGLIILDVGAGTHGGTPTAPAFVSQYKYPIGNTHVAWRHGRYVFVGDEIYPSDWDPNAAAPIEARGYIHVIDVEDIDRPVEVARYEVPEAGAHNVWAEGDRLYVGYYQGGLRVVDVSGELRGDLYRQGREVAAFKTTDAVT
ncbi:MAG TPA: Ig-like domain-containing protein, partial [Longimicrobiales bacterium]|nr:Ig-like domain-containing protein [Longimicrobiales bacterium]